MAISVPAAHRDSGRTETAGTGEPPVVAADESPARRSLGAARRRPVRWWWAGVVVGVTLLALTATVLAGAFTAPGVGSAAWWALTLVLHAPFAVILAFLVGGMIERLGYLRSGRAPRRPGPLPVELPTVCVQLPMFNEHAVAHRVIGAAGALDWPADRLEIQVLDDSTDPASRRLVDDACAALVDSGVACVVLRRQDRVGYKAGALEAGRKLTDAEFVAVFDADFVPPRDYLRRTVAHFYRPGGQPDPALALVQTQWGHLNADESGLTRAQSLWVDDHHTLQMSWRSATWEFVNFTGTAGVWRAAAIESVGGWRAASLVEDCELSFRTLFAGYRTAFVKEIVAPAELPDTVTAYKAQQKRWTQGWVQLQRLHLRTLLTGLSTPPPRRVHLLYHMLITWQWPAWTLWIMTLPLLIHLGLWIGSFGLVPGVAVYLLPPALWLITSTVMASTQTRHDYTLPAGPGALGRRLARVVPYAIISTGMLPHQFSAFLEGLFGPMHSEFERTPKTAVVSPAAATLAGQAPEPPVTRRHAVKIHWPYVLAEAFFVCYQFGWAVVLLRQGTPWPALGAVLLAGCVLYLAYFYGDNLGRVCFVVARGAERHRLREPLPRP